MGDWKPDKTVHVTQSDNRTVYFWIVPAQVEGTSDVALKTPQGEQKATLDLKQEYQHVSGTARIGDKELQIDDGKLTGDRLTFSVDGATYTCQIPSKSRQAKSD